MFDRFSDAARRVVALAEEEARRLGHPHIGTEHLVLGLLADGESAAAQALEAAGATLAGAREKVAEAVGRNGPATTTAGGLSFTPRANRALERASRFSLQRRDPDVGTEHLLLGVLDVEGRAGQVLRGLSVDVVSLRDAVDMSSEARSPVAVVKRDVPEDPSPRCQACGTPLTAGLGYRVLPASGETGESRDYAVVYCSTCGSAIGFGPT